MNKEYFNILLNKLSKIKFWQKYCAFAIYFISQLLLIMQTLIRVLTSIIYQMYFKHPYISFILKVKTLLNK